MRISEDIKLDYEDVLLCPQWSTVSSREDVDLIRTYKMPNEQYINGIGIIAANMDSIGTFKMAEVLNKNKMFCAIHKHYSKEKLVEFFRSEHSQRSFYTLGINDSDFLKLDEVSKEVKLPLLNIDIANGHTERFVRCIQNIRKDFPKSTIMAGNVCTPNMVQHLIINGTVNIVKIGIGSGKVCSTRSVSGHGFPQLSATADAANVAHSLDAFVCSDGGVKNSGDCVKSFAAGSDFTMLGNFFSGYEENDGEWEYDYEGFAETEAPHDEPQKKSLKFYGMSSKEAMEKYNGGVSDYKTSEGECINVPYKGSVEVAIKQILGGLRSGCAYSGARTLKDLPKCATFLKVNRIK